MKKVGRLTVEEYKIWAEVTNHLPMKERMVLIADAVLTGKSPEQDYIQAGKSQEDIPSPR